MLYRAGDLLLGVEVRMRVQRLLMSDGSESWTVLGPAGEPVGVVQAFLAHLQALDRSPTTVRTYATTLKLWLEFLDGLGGVGADRATAEHVSRFVAWLRSPAGQIAVLDGGTGRCGPATVNRHLAAPFIFDYRARNGVVLAQSLVAWRRVNRGGYRPSLHHMTAGRPAVSMWARWMLVGAMSSTSLDSGFLVSAATF